MERSTVVKILGALAAAIALVAAGALLPKPPAPDSVQGQGVLGQAVLGQATLAPTDSVLGQATLAPSATFHVYVCGAVRRPGVYTLPSDARVIDAIAQAGGAAANSDLEQLNLAQPLADAMKVDVPVKGQQLSAAMGAADLPAAGLAGTASAGRSSRHHASRSGSHKLSAGQTLDINIASESELVQLPGVGPSLARRIVEYRTANGPFQMPDDLQNVSGIGASKFAKMEPFIRI
jgi:competence protein ComEA